MIQNTFGVQILQSVSRIKTNKSKMITSIKQGAAENSIWQPSKKTSARIKEEKS